MVCYASTQSALIPLAKLRDFYATEGLDVELRLHPSGRQALEAMLADQCTVATAADTPVVHASLSGRDFRIIAAITMYDNVEKIIVRSDRGILAPADLRGRRVAVTEFTAGHYFLDLYLAAKGIRSADVKQVYLPAQDVVSAFRRGEVDAMAHWEPNIQTLAREFGTRAKVFSIPGLHVTPFLLVGATDYLRRNPVAVERVVRAPGACRSWC